MEAHCSIGCAKCHEIRRAKNPIFQAGDRVSWYAPACRGHGRKGTIIGNSRCELLQSNIYDVEYDDGNIVGHHEKDNSLRFIGKTMKITDFIVI